jgi:ATP-dependent helicase/nuclease subunit B
MKATAIVGELREHRALHARLREATGQKDFTMMVVFPTLSLMREIEEELLRQPEIPGIGGIRFLLFEGFVSEATEGLGLKRRKPSQLQQELLVTAAWRVLDQSGRLSYLNRIPLTAAYRQALLDGIAEWKRAGLTPDLLVKWATDQGPKEQQLALFYFTYQHLLTAHGFIEEDGLLEQLRQIRSRTGPVTDRPHVLLYGFTDLTPQQADFITALTLWFDFEALLDPTNVSDLQELIRQHFSFKKPEIISPAAGGRTVLEQLQRSFWQNETPALSRAENDLSVQLIRADGRSRQALALAREIVALLRSDSGYQLTDFLILSPQPQEFLQSARPVFGEYQLPLAEVPRGVQEFPAVLQLRRTLETVTGGWQWVELSGLLRLFLVGSDRRSRDRLILELAEQYGALSGKERWLKLLDDPECCKRLDELGISPEPLQRCLEFLRSWPETASGGRYLQLVGDWFALAAEESLARLTDDPALLSIQMLNYQAACQLQQACDEVLDNQELLPDLMVETTLEAFCRFFDDYLLRGEVAPTELYQDRIRVLPPREARGLRAKVVFVTGLEQGVFPRNYINDWKLSPVSRFELKTLGVELETGEQYQEQERLAFYWALQTAGERLYLVAREQDEAGQPLNYSSFLTAVIQLFPDLPAHSRYYPLEPQVQPDFRHCFAPGEERRRWAGYLMQDHQTLPASERQICDYLFQTPYYRQLALKVVHWHYRPEITPGRPVSTRMPITALLTAEFGPDHSFSVTALDEYRKCPYSFFLKRLLRIKPLIEPGLLPQVIELGTLYHQILREFGERYRGQAWQAERRPEYEAALEQLLQRVFAEWRQAAANDFVTVVLAIQEQQVRRVLQRWLAAELHWAEQTGYRYSPYLLEYSFGQPTDSADPASASQPFRLETDAAGTVRLNGRIDRVDREAGGHLIIYDYKLGQSHTTGSVLDLQSLQIPVYLRALEQLLGEPDATVGGCYLSLKGLSRTGGGVWRRAKTGLEGRSKGLLGEAEWDEWLEGMELEVGTTIAAIRAGYFYLSEKECPDYCGYRTVCRSGERKGGAD